jgi:hypothetical protein
MSNQFVQESNQNMLWKIVSSTPQLTDFFKMLPPGSKEDWFKGIIHQIYGETYGRNVPLRDINKRALDAMTESIKALKRRQQGQQRQEQQQQQQQPLQQEPYPPQQPYQHQTQGQLPQPSIQSSAAFRDSRESQMMDQFNRRQAEYESMTKKPAPTPVFNESIKDEAIQDLSKAVSEYMSLRDADMTSVHPMTPVDTLVKPMTPVDTLVKPMTPVDTSVKHTTTRIQISDPISISLEEHEPTTHKKQVQWGENIEHVFDKTQSIYESALIKKIQALEDSMDSLTHTVESLTHTVESLTHTVESLTHNMELMIQKFDAMINPQITKSIDE